MTPGMKIDLPNILTDTDRHGTTRYYYRPKRKGGKTTGKMVRLHATPGTPEFLEEYRRAVNGETTKPKRPVVAKATDPRSLRWLVEGYYNSARYKTLADSTRNARRLILDGICAGEVETKAGRKKRGDLPFVEMRAKHIRAVRDEKIDYPEAANSRVKALGQVFDWALIEEHVEIDPTQGVEFLAPTNPDGFHQWTVDEVLQFQKRWPIGTRQRVAMDVLLYAGVRRSDGVRLGRQFERDGWLHFTEEKNRKSRALSRRGKPPKPKKREVPILPVLRATLDAGPTGELVYIISAYGQPYKPESFGNWFRDACNEAGLPHCSAHGLRKAGATLAAENGATPHQLMAIYGWERLEQAELYTRQVNRRRLAGDAMSLIALPKRDNTGP
jgi:integrase